MWLPFTQRARREPWNKGKVVGQKSPLKLKDIWAIRIRLELAERKRELALFNLAIDSKLRGCDLVRLRVRDIAHGDRIAVNRRAILTRFGVESASKIDHPVPCAALPAAWGDMGCCAWKRLARFAGDGWCRESRSAR